MAMAARVALMVLCACACVCECECEATGRRVLFTTEVQIDKKPVSVSVAEGDSPAEVARGLGIQHSLPVDQVPPFPRPCGCHLDTRTLGHSVAPHCELTASSHTASPQQRAPNS